MLTEVSKKCQTVSSCKIVDTCQFFKKKPKNHRIILTINK